MAGTQGIRQTCRPLEAQAANLNRALCPLGLDPKPVVPELADSWRELQRLWIDATGFAPDFQTAWTGSDDSPAERRRHIAGAGKPPHQSLYFGAFRRRGGAAEPADERLHCPLAQQRGAGLKRASVECGEYVAIQGEIERRHEMIVRVIECLPG